MGLATLEVAVSQHGGAFENVNALTVNRVENAARTEQHIVRPVSAVDIC